MLGGILAAAVAVIVVVALLLSGLIPTSGSGGGSGGAGVETSSEAMAVANSVASGVAHGPWALNGVGGLSVLNPSTETLPYNVHDCAATGSSNFTIPASTGEYSTGRLSSWTFEYVNETRTAFLILQVANGQVSELLLQGANCPIFSIGAPIETPFVSSDVAASAALNSGNISGFVGNHSSAAAEEELIQQGAANGGLQWLLTYTTCSPIFSPGVPSQGSVVQAFVNATTGLLNHTDSQPSSNCAFAFYRVSQIPIEEAFVVTNPVLSMCPSGSTFATNGCSAGDYTYSISITTSYLWFFPTGFWLDEASGSVYYATGDGGFSVLTSSGSVAAQTAVAAQTPMAMPHSFTTFGSGVSGISTISTSDTILIDMGTLDPAGMGLTFEANGPSDAFTGNTPPLTLP